MKGVFYWGTGENGGLIKNISSTAQAEISPEKSRRHSVALLCLRAGARIMPQRKPPENAGEPKNNTRCNDKVQHQLRWLSKRFDEQPGGNVRNNYDRNDPAEHHGVVHGDAKSERGQV